LSRRPQYGKARAIRAPITPTWLRCVTKLPSTGKSTHGRAPRKEKHLLHLGGDFFGRTGVLYKRLPKKDNVA